MVELSTKAPREPQRDRNPLRSGAQAHESQPAAHASTVDIEYFTDPLCSWSWGFEPQWRRLRFDFRGRVRWRYRMGGMIRDWAGYSDPFNSVSRPVQMAPQWIEVHHLSGMPLDPRVWLEDAPHSSYPACLAFKAAEQQSPHAAEAALRRLREMVMLERRNIARREVLLDMAAELTRREGIAFDATRFGADLDNPAVSDAFREDLMLAGYRAIGRFPTLLLRRGASENGLLVVGYRTYSMLRSALLHLAPELEPTRPFGTLDQYRQYWGSLTPREEAEFVAG